MKKNLNIVVSITVSEEFPNQFKVIIKLQKKLAKNNGKITFNLIEYKLYVVAT